MSTTAAQPIDPDMYFLGRAGSPAEILAVVRTHLRDEKVLATLWQGAAERMASSVTKSLEQKNAVLEAALSGPPFATASRETLGRLLYFAGHMGEDWHIIQGAARAKGHPLLVQAMLNGAERREKEHLASGIKQKHAVCRAVIASLPPYKMKIEPTMEIVLECMAKIGTEDEIAAIAARYGHDDYTCDFMCRAAEEAALVSRDKAGIADLIRDLFKNTPPLPPEDLTPDIRLGVNPLGLKKSKPQFRL